LLIEKVFSGVSLVLNNLAIFSFLFAVPFKLAASTDKIVLARLGNTDAQLSLGFSLSSGNHLQQQEALYWMKQAGNNGNLNACQYLGNAYHRGVGTAPNLVKSSEWYLKAVALGDYYSLLKAGHVFELDGFPAHACAAYRLAENRIPDTNSKDFITRLKKQVPNLTNKKIEESINFLQKKLSTIPTFKTDYQPNPKTRTENIILEDGSTYIGKVLNGTPHGYGRKVSPNGTSYIGNFADGLEDGMGTSYSERGVAVYSGIWKHGKPAK
jgi:TPR repeat protein